MSLSKEQKYLLENYIGYKLEYTHLSAIMNPHDPIHKKIMLLGADDIIKTNDYLRKVGNDKGWGDRYIAFATNECGDYFVYDKDDKHIFYVDPMGTLEENRASCSECNYIFKSFADWRSNKLAQEDD